MNKYLLSILLLIAPSLIKAQTVADPKTVIKLEKADLSRGDNMMKALSKRKSTREYADRKLSMRDLSDLLWAANGINRPEENKRTAPSAMNRQDIEIYVCMADGNYHYHAKNHELHLVSRTDVRPIKTAPVTLVLVGIEAQTWSAMDAGIVSQNISLFCSSVDLATVPRGMGDKKAIAEALQLKEKQEIYLNHPVGYFKE